MTRTGPRLGLDLILIGAVALLLCIGSLMVYSASLVVAYNELQDDTYFLVRQLVWIAVGVMVMGILAHVDYHYWRRYSKLMLLLGIVLLGLVLIPGVGVRSYGSARWIKLGPFLQIQPSELIKLVLVLYMADWLARKGEHVRQFFYSSLPFVIIVSVVCGLVVLEPDFGTTVVIAATSITIFFIAGANLWHFMPVVGLIIAGFWFVMTRAAYRNQRIEAWVNPWQDSQGAGWHTIQTLIALGSGGLTGLGLGASRQKHSWLVNAHTDAIMAIVGEELGLLGTMAVLALFAVLVWRGVRIAYLAGDPYGRLLAAGLTAMIFWQATLNLAVVTNSAPYTGVTLPFMSFGGSSIVVSMAAMGLLLSISRYRFSQPTRRLEERSRPDGRGARRARGPSRAAQPVLSSVGKLRATFPMTSSRRASSLQGRDRAS